MGRITDNSGIRTKALRPASLWIAKVAAALVFYPVHPVHPVLPFALFQTRIGITSGEDRQCDEPNRGFGLSSPSCRTILATALGILSR